MTIVNDTRVVRLQRTAARTGHQHSNDERIVEYTTDEIITATDVVSLPPGSLISLKRGPAQGHTEEGSILNATANDIGGVAGGQSTSVSFDSEDAGASAAAIFVTELDFTATLSAAGEYAINYKTFQIKTYTAVPTGAGSRILVTYTWAPIREYLEWDPEDLEPDLEAFGDGPHQPGDGYGTDGYEIFEGCNINIETFDGYKEISVDVDSLAGDGLTVVEGPDGCDQLAVEADAGDSIIEGCSIDIADVDGYKEISVDVGSLAGDGLTVVVGPDGCDQLAVDLDGYAQGCRTIFKTGDEAEDPDYRSIFSTDGYEYTVGLDRLLVTINGLLQFSGEHYTETDETSITFMEPVDCDDQIAICILPGSLGGAGEDNTTLQGAYNNSTSKQITLDSGAIIIEQGETTNSGLKINTVSSTNPARALDVSHEGTGEAIRGKSVSETKPSILIQKDAASRNTVLNTLTIERTTSHISGGLTGIGSAILTQLEDTGGNLFNASRMITGTEDATDSAEKSYLSLELMDDGVFTEHARFTSIGRFALNTTSPKATLHAQGDGYFSDELEVAGRVKAGSDDTFAPLNVPVFDSDPPSIEDGDVWITDSAGTRQLHVRISGVTYSVTLT